MKKRDKKQRISQNEDSENITKNIESGFIYDFFISEDEKEPAAAFQSNKPPAERKKKRATQKDQSVAFFLPDLDGHDD